MGSHSLGVPWLQAIFYGHLQQKLSPCCHGLTAIPMTLGSTCWVTVLCHRDCGACCCLTGGKRGSHPNIPGPGAATLGRSWRQVSCCSLCPPETSCFRHTSGRKQEEGNLVLLHNCRVNQLKRGDSYVSVSNTACALSSGELWHKKEVKTQLRSSTSSLFSCNNHIQNRELLLLFICGFGEDLLKWPKLQCLFPEFRRVAWSGSTAHRMPLRGAQQRSTYFMNYKWPQAEKQLPVCLVQPRGRNLQAKTATEIKEAKEVFCCNLRVSNFSERWRG